LDWYCEDAIIKREPFREQHLKRLKNFKDSSVIQLRLVLGFN